VNYSTHADAAEALVAEITTAGGRAIAAAAFGLGKPKRKQLHQENEKQGQDNKQYEFSRTHVNAIKAAKSTAANSARTTNELLLVSCFT
jgi:hypothetical protein